jgi:hypothetical protein
MPTLVFVDTNIGWARTWSPAASMRRFVCQGRRGGRCPRSPTRFHPHSGGHWGPVPVAIRLGLLSDARALVSGSQLRSQSPDRAVEGWHPGRWSTSAAVPVRAQAT